MLTKHYRYKARVMIINSLSKFMSVDVDDDGILIEDGVEVTDQGLNFFNLLLVARLDQRFDIIQHCLKEKM